MRFFAATPGHFTPAERKPRSGGDAQATPDFEPLISPGPWQFDDPVTGQLYDLENDPYETTDLFEDQLEQVNRLINILNEAVNSGRSR